MTSTDLPAELSPQEAMDLLAQEGIRFLDVREDQERAMGFIPGSDHIPMGQIPDAADPQNPDRNPLLESDDHLVVYCAAGARSAKVVQFLMAGGRQRISNLAGGIQGWAQAGGAITR